MEKTLKILGTTVLISLVLLFFQTYIINIYKDNSKDIAIDKTIENNAKDAPYSIDMIYKNKIKSITKINVEDNKCIVYYNFEGTKEEIKKLLDDINDTKEELKIINIEKLSGKDEIKVDFYIQYE